MYLTQDYEDIIELFNLNKVKYLVAGAYAMAVFGYARSTYDIDLWVSRDTDNVRKVLRSLEEFGVPFVLDKEVNKELFSSNFISVFFTVILSFLSLALFKISSFLLIFCL